MCVSQILKHMILDAPNKNILQNNLNFSISSMTFFFLLKKVITVYDSGVYINIYIFI